MCWETNSGPLEEPEVLLLTTNTFFQSIKIFFWSGMQLLEVAQDRVSPALGDFPQWLGTKMGHFAFSFFFKIYHPMLLTLQGK